MTQRSDAQTFRGRVRPGAGRVLIRVLPESEDYTIPGTGIRLWLPHPSSHEGFTGEIAVECAPYIDANTGAEFKAQYAKGAIVVVGKYTGTSLTLNRDLYKVCREQDIVCEVVPAADEEIPIATASEVPRS